MLTHAIAASTSTSRGAARRAIAMNNATVITAP